MTKIFFMDKYETSPENVIRAKYDAESITIYQAYNSEIAIPALKNQSFIKTSYKIERMTWIKPSFLWMMYRSGWATKKNQEHVLSIKIKREGFDWALINSCLTHFNNQLYTSQLEWHLKKNNSPVLVQWDPERDIFLNPMKIRAIQVGLSGIAVTKYISEWILEINDITDLCKEVSQLIQTNDIKLAKQLIPNEMSYPLDKEIMKTINHNLSS
jgi:hypothetical protein